MKFGGNFSKYLGICVAVVAGLLVTSTQAAVSKATVRAVRGSATVTSDKGATWKPVKVGQTIAPMSTIRTAPESSVDLFLDQNGPVLRVTADTSIGIDKLDYENTGVETVIETQLDLRAGRIFGNVKKLSAASRYEVKLPNGVAGIRGTVFLMDATGMVSVYFGSVAVSYYDGTGQLVSRIVSSSESLNLNTSQLVSISGSDFIEFIENPPIPPRPPVRIIPVPVVIPVNPNPSGDQPGNNDGGNGGGNEQPSRPAK